MSEDIRPARPGDIYGLIELWDLGFPGEHDFGIFIFGRFGRPENVLVYEENGRLSAMLLMLPRTVCCRGENFSASYIMGVTTRPELRGKGVMHRLMEAAHETLKQRGTDLAMLIPATPGLFDYYARFGYAPFFYISNSTEDRTGLSSRYTFREDSEDTGAFDTIYRTAMADSVFVARSREDWLCAMEEHRRFGGGVLLLYRSVQPVAYAFFGKNNGKIKINETFGLDDDARKAVVAAVFSKNEAESAALVSPSGPGGKPFGAALALSQKGEKLMTSAGGLCSYINLIHN